MAIDEDQTSPVSLIKWPFYASAVFILGFVLFFALNRPPDQPLDQWQLATCVLASALASILLFLPFLLQKFLELVLSPAADREEQLVQKIYFELKELREDLGALGAKVEKVPAGIEKIVADGPGNDDAAFTETVKLGTEIDALRKEIGERLDGLRKPIEAAAALPIDPTLGVIPEVLATLGARIDETLETVQSLKPKSRKRSKKKKGDGAKEIEPEPEEPKQEPEPEDTPEEKVDSELEETEPTEEQDSEEEQPDAEPEPETDEEPEGSEPEGEDASEPLEGDEPESEEESVAEPTEEAEQGEDAAEKETQPEDETEDASEDEEDPRETETEQEQDSETEEDAEETEDADPEQAELDLPDPAETLRKVDAILEETNPDHVPADQKDETPEEDAPEAGGATSVVANVMIGIGNKPFLRGEGPGLSWDKGIPMNFVEIGKWAWSPPDKEAPLVVQVYRNDEEADPSGRHDVAPGQKLAITPDFED